MLGRCACSCSWTLNFVAATPARSTRSAVTSYPGHGEAAERALEIVERQPGVEQRAERHVARNPGEAIEIQHARHRHFT